MSAESEWHALEYDEVSSLQKWLADRSLAQLTLRGDERVLDVGCGDGKIPAEIADRLPSGSILGVDRSHDMIEYARKHNPRANLDFTVCGAREMAFPGEFDLAVFQHPALGARTRNGAARAPRLPKGRRRGIPADGRARHAQVPGARDQ